MDQTMERLFMNVCMDLWASDADISYKLFISTVKQYISNLRSHIGDEARRHEKELGITDETGMTGEEQDRALEKQIKGYEELIKYLETDENWAW